MGKTTVLVLFGGRSSEHSISCISAGSILQAIDREFYEVVAAAITPDGDWVLHSGRYEELRAHDGNLPKVTEGTPVTLSLSPERRGIWVAVEENRSEWIAIDVVFPVLHGPYGEDGAVQGALEIADIPYVGSGVFASAACMDKAHTKRLLQSAGIPSGRWQAFQLSNWDQVERDELLADLGLPVFVKPARAGSSVGVSKVHDKSALAAAVALAGSHDPHIIVESSVEGALEIECGVLANAAGVIRTGDCARIRVREGHEFYDFEAKYLDNSVELIVPADISDDLVKQVQRLAVEAFTALDCEGLARVDFFIDPDGAVSVNEINTMPGFTPISMYPRMWSESGVSYPELIDVLIGEALARSPGLR